jgi:hypothetical protein
MPHQRVDQAAAVLPHRAGHSAVCPVRQSRLRVRPGRRELVRATDLRRRGRRSPRPHRLRVAANEFHLSSFGSSIQQYRPSFGEAATTNVSSAGAAICALQRSRRLSISATRQRFRSLPCRYTGLGHCPAGDARCPQRPFFARRAAGRLLTASASDEAEATLSHIEVGSRNCAMAFGSRLTCIPCSGRASSIRSTRLWPLAASPTSRPLFRPTFRVRARPPSLARADAPSRAGRGSR